MTNATKSEAREILGQYVQSSTAGNGFLHIPRIIGDVSDVFDPIDYAPAHKYFVDRLRDAMNPEKTSPESWYGLGLEVLLFWDDGPRLVIKGENSSALTIAGEYVWKGYSQECNLGIPNDRNAQVLNVFKHLDQARYFLLNGREKLDKIRESRGLRRLSAYIE